jgi:molybdenum cofactor biosynthesis enzyme MoaA
MKLEDIGFYTLSNYRARNTSVESPLWRCELLLTNKCNFHCPYCRGLAGQDISFEDAKHILGYWFDNDLKNVRFSGGEPTLYKRLHELVSLCRINGVERIAVSTNGSAEIAYYEQLLNAGVNDFSISLDACCSADGDIMTGTKESWALVVKNIKLLSKQTYVTVGMVYNELNEKRIKETIQYAHGLGVADIRVIPSAQYGNKMSFDVSENILNAHPILKYRLSGSRNVRGISPDDSRICKLVLDDMAVWNGYHYPCIIYLRENGKPIGKVSENMRQERYEWYLNHNSFDDPICRTNCLDVCVEYNNYANLYT